MEDLYKLPFTEKDELRKSQEEDPPLGSHCVTPMDDIIRIHSSSGTTGIPTFVGITRHDHKVWTEITARSLFAKSVRPKGLCHRNIGMRVASSTVYLKPYTFNFSYHSSIL